MRHYQGLFGIRCYLRIDLALSKDCPATIKPWVCGHIHSPACGRHEHAIYLKGAFSPVLRGLQSHLNRRTQTQAHTVIVT